MPKRPISPDQHALIDYGFAAGNLLLPQLLGFSDKARAVFSAFGAVQGGLNAFTIQPYAVHKLVPFALHGLIEKSSLPVYIAVPLLTGALRQPQVRAYWIALGLALTVVYNLTDWDARKTGKKSRR
jgi:hypothetical protein